jgi:DNA polymerase-3 subunit epsilon
LARRKFPGAPASLDALCQRFGISKAEREEKGHGALLDSELLAKVFIELTGGKQTALFGSAASGTSSGAGGTGRPTRQRGKELPPRLTEAEREAHQAFVGELATPIWAKVGS